MTQAEIAEIQAEIRAIHGDLSEAVRELKEQHQAIERHSAEALERIERQVRLTNGRVSSLELQQARLRGGLVVLGLFAPLLTALAVDYITR
jgi:chromosome segregation ATPase